MSGSSNQNQIGTLLWSTSVKGTIAGTPLISSDGKSVYVIHNTHNSAVVTVLENNQGRGPIISETIDLRPMAKYGPPTLATIDGVDHVYWADAHDGGYGIGGRVHTIVSTDPATVHSERSFASSSIIPPTVSKDGKSLWLGGRDAMVHGWAENAPKPVWAAQLNRSLRNESYRK